MKRRALYIPLLWLAALCGTLRLAAAGPDLRFEVLPLGGDEVSEKTALTITQHIEQGLSRSQALSSNPYEVFAVNPTLIFGHTMESAGLVRDVAVLNAELTLSAINKVDGTVYYTVTLPLKASATDGRENAAQKLAASLKATDPAFVRFVRQARQKIEDYYAGNCSKILATAQTLADTGRPDEALAYLSAVSPSVDCYDMAAIMMTQLTDTPDTEPIEMADITPPTADPDTVAAEPSAYVPEPEPLPQPQPAPQPNPESAPEVRPQAPQPEIIIGSDDMLFSIVSCTGDWSTHRINIVAKFENLLRNKSQAIAYVATAIDSEGTVLPESKVKNTNGWFSSCTVETPYKVPVKLQFYLSGFDEKIDRLAYVEIVIRNVKVIIKNLSVQW